MEPLQLVNAMCIPIFTQCPISADELWPSVSTAGMQSCIN